MKKTRYLFSKLMKKLQIASVLDCRLEQPCKIHAQSSVVGTTMGKYSYCGYGCTLLYCDIGRFCSIADQVSIGLAGHPMEWVSTSSAFYQGAGSIPKDLASLKDPMTVVRTTIGHDVWIGKGVFLKAGIHVGNGAVIGMGSVVTKDVPPYAVVVGNPARMVRMRFPADVAEELERSEWWNFSPEKLKNYAQYWNRPEEFLKLRNTEA